MQRALDRTPAGSPATARWPRALACALVLLGPLGCSDDRVLLPGAESSTGEPSSGSTTTSGSSSSSTASSTTGLADDTTDTASTSTGDREVTFLPEPDMGPSSCGIFTQDCPPGLKCVAWGDDGGSSWNTYGCKPVVEDPVGIDEVCHVEGTIASGIDDCELGAMCWFIDPETNEGICVPLCIGSERLPTCEDEGRFPYWHASIPLCQCLSICNPIQQDCPVGRGCYPTGVTWTCIPDGSADAGAYGDACVISHEGCDPGLVCLDSAVATPGLPCEGEYGCCMAICDLDDPLGDTQCPGAASGEICLPRYEDGEAPAGYEHVGVCILP